MATNARNLGRGHRMAPPVPVDASRAGAPMVRPKRVACPECGAQPGDPCLTRDGGERTAHRSRHRMAVRAGEVDRPTTVKWQRSPSGARKARLGSRLAMVSPATAASYWRVLVEDERGATIYAETVHRLANALGEAERALRG